MNLKVELLFKDRIGIVADISVQIAGQGLSIVSTEVVTRKDKAHVFVEIENDGGLPRKEILLETLKKIEGLIEIGFVETLPSEERENRIRVVLDNINNGVISIDREGKVTTINQVAKKTLGCAHKKVVGQSIQSLNLPDYNILECLEGYQFSNVKKNLINDSGRVQYFATGRPIRDMSGRIIGAVEIAKDMQEIKKLARSISEPTQPSFGDIIGQNPAINSAIAFAQKMADVNAIVCIRGKSGTGKELFARAIHSASGLTGPFIPINCAAVPEQLLESELFGYTGGSFTGGRKEGKLGLFEIARNGTVFLDEIGDMPMRGQAKILRVIQEKRVRRIGGSEEIPINSHIITATNRNLEQMVEKKQFREDLYYRINVLPIHIPPLQERLEDIPLLVEHFLFQLSDKLGKNIQSISPAATDKLLRHNWPGNIRELKNVIERAAILTDSEKIDVNAIILNQGIGLEKALVKVPFKTDIDNDQPLKLMMAAYEKEIITHALKRAKSIRKTAKKLKLSHTALLNKMKKHNIKSATK